MPSKTRKKKLEAELPTIQNEISGSINPGQKSRTYLYEGHRHLMTRHGYCVAALLDLAEKVGQDDTGCCYKSTLSSAEMFN